MKNAVETEEEMLEFFLDKLEDSIRRFDSRDLATRVNGGGLLDMYGHLLAPDSQEDQLLSLCAALLDAIQMQDCALAFNVAKLISTQAFHMVVNLRHRDNTTNDGDVQYVY